MQIEETVLLTFDEVISKCEKEQTHLLLGNGFSIAFDSSIFTYNGLFDSADFSEKKHLETLFISLKTRDFENVIRIINDSTHVLNAYSGGMERRIPELEEDAVWLKNLLIEVLTTRHPEHSGVIPEKKYKSCRQFLNHFNRKYTLNYDLLLYWVLMHNSETISVDANDGFYSEDEDDDYVVWDDGKTAKVWFLHGALHLFDDGASIKKITWSRTGKILKDQIRDSLQRNIFPIFVSEGESEQKLQRILHNAYLHKGLRSLSSIRGTLCVYGMSFSENDDHIIDCIVQSTVKTVYVSIFGNPEDTYNREIIKKAKFMEDKRIQQNSKTKGRTKLEVYFYDAASAQVWDKF